MKKVFFFLLILPMSKISSGQSPIYTSKAFSIYSDRVVQGPFVSKATSDFQLESNYASPANEFQSADIIFKFAVNGRDNELPAGVDHQFTFPSGAKNAETPVIEFGKQLKKKEDQTAGFLPPNSPLKIKLDFRSQLKQMKELGYFLSYQGAKIFKEEFKGVFVAGSSSPLSWDFDNLASREDFKMKDPDGDGIYEIDLVLNAHSDEKKTASTWKLVHDLKPYPAYKSEFPISDAIYNMSLDEMITAIEPDHTFRTGKEWAGVWTRDISYSILLSMAILQPEVAKISLRKKVKNKRVIQDTGTGGAWPVSTDRMIWAVAAFEIYKVTGELDWLGYAYEVVRNSVNDDLQVAFDPSTGLMKGESSFLDWREQTYPRWMQPADIFESSCLGTNAVHYQCLQVLKEMAEIFQDKASAARYAKVSEDLKLAINTRLWNEQNGYFGQFLYGRNHKILSPKSEALGEALSVWFGITDPARSQTVVEKTPVVPFGIPCIYPQIPGISPYHNKAVWPFVQSYWALAAAKAGNETSVMESIAAIYRPAALFVTNKENFVCSNGDYAGTVINSSNMLWSLSGNIALVYRVFFGMNFQQNGLAFHPFVPKPFEGKRTLKNFRYRKAVLDIEMVGSGNNLQSFVLDGKKLDKALIPIDLVGNHSVVITLAPNDLAKKKTNLSSETAVSPETPQVQINNQNLVWTPVENASGYKILENGVVIKTQSATQFVLPALSTAEYQVIAVDKKHKTESFASEPLVQTVPSFETEVFMQPDSLESSISSKGFKGAGFVEISGSRNQNLKVKCTVPEKGRYALQFWYANGNGPVNTENKCAIRTFRQNGKMLGTFVFPQRGKGEWSDWGFSNGVQVDLEKGEHTFTLEFDPSNENMNGSVNQALLNYLRVIKL